MRSEQQSGVVLMAVVIILLPVIVVVGAFTAAMTSRSERLVDEVNQEKALMAAESGVDLAIWAGQVGRLEDGVTFGYQLANDTSCYIVPTHLEADGRDNDGDSQVDEEDEDVFQVVARGTYRGTVRNIVAYLGPLPAIPLFFPAAVTVMNPDVTIDLRGTPYISGYDTNLDGTRGDPANDVPGLAVGPPGTISDLDDELNGGEETNVIGAGGVPSLGTSPALDVDSIVTFVQNSADLVLTNRRYAAFDFGSGSTGGPRITYRAGDVAFSGNSYGAGILVVTGNLTVSGTFRFDGVVIVLGDLELGSGTAQIYGAMVQGPGGSIISNRGTMDVYYSSEAIQLANSISGRYVAFNGWQELAR